MPFYNAEEKGRPVTIKDEGITLTPNVSSIDMTGVGVDATNIGDDVTENVPGGGGSGTMNTVKEGGVQVGDSDIVTLNFNGNDFNLTESPDTEINIVINDGGIDHNALSNTHNLTTDIDHNNIANLTIGDDHTQYALLNGRSGGQTLIGGIDASDSLTLKGKIIFGSVSVYDEVNDRLGIGTVTPSVKVDIFGTDNKFRLSYDALNYADSYVDGAGSLFIKPSNALTYFNSAAVNNRVLIYNYAGGSGYYTDITGTTIKIRAAGADVVKLSNTGYNYITGGNVGINIKTPRRKLDIVSTANPQIRLTYTDNAVYTDFQTDSGGDLIITPTGSDTTIAGTLTTTSTITATDLTLSAPSNVYALSHDSFADFVANEHIDHTGVSVLAGTGMSGGGTIDGSVTLNCTITQYTDELAQDAIGAMIVDTNTINLTYTDLTPELKADVLYQDSSSINFSDDIAGLKADVLPAGVDHDSLLNFVANEHIDHTAVTLTAGTGLTGGGDISASRTFNVDTGIADNKIVQIDSATVADNDYAKFTLNGLEGRSYSEVKTDLSLDNVENTALSTWTGSANLTTLGVISAGTWSADTIPVNKGGTGQISYTDGQLLIGNTTGNTLSKATLTAGTGISVTNGSGAITLSTNDAQIDHNSLLNYLSTEHFLQTAITNVSTGLATGILKVTNGTGALSSITDNSTNWDDAYTHISSDGSSHTFIDQDVTSGSSPTFDGTNFTGIDISTGTNLAGTANQVILTNDTLSTPQDIHTAAIPTFGGLNCNGTIDFTSTAKVTHSSILTFELDTDIASGNVYDFNPTLTAEITAASGEQVWMNVDVNVNQTGTANYCGLGIDVTETSTGSGVDKLICAKIGGVNRFVATPTGGIFGGNGTASLTWATASANLTLTDGTTTYVYSSTRGIEVPTNKAAFVAASFTNAGLFFSSGAARYNFRTLTGVEVFDIYVTGGAGNIVCGAQSILATTATDGFLYIPRSAGAPTGTPTAYTGKVAMQYDTTNNRLYIYNGSWKSVALA